MYSGTGTRRPRGAARTASGVVLSLDCRRRIWFCTISMDMRRLFDGLSAMVRNELGADPTIGNLFVIVNRRRTMMKVLAFDGDGYWIWSKRLEAGRFESGDENLTGKVALNGAALLALIEGADVVIKRQRKRYRRAAVRAWPDHPTATAGRLVQAAVVRPHFGEAPGVRRGRADEPVCGTRHPDAAGLRGPHPGDPLPPAGKTPGHGRIGHTAGAAERAGAHLRGREHRGRDAH